jgi:hypothetical protein
MFMKNIISLVIMIVFIALPAMATDRINNNLDKAQEIVSTKKQTAKSLREIADIEDSDAIKLAGIVASIQEENEKQEKEIKKRTWISGALGATLGAAATYAAISIYNKYN